MPGSGELQYVPVEEEVQELLLKPNLLKYGLQLVGADE
jgi:hypothetical protein